MVARLPLAVPTRQALTMLRLAAAFAYLLLAHVPLHYRRCLRDERHAGLAFAAVATLAAYEGEWANGTRTGRGISKGADGAVEVGRYLDGIPTGESVRLELHDNPAPRNVSTPEAAIL